MMAPASHGSAPSTAKRWHLRGRRLVLDRPLVMGILNLTPDSFSDGGELADLSAVVRRAGEMVDEGAAILDIGGESTRPGSIAVEAGEELRRVLPAVERLAREFPIPLSIDTRKASVAAAALDAGASIVNDVSALTFDPAMAEVVAKSRAGVVLMHSRGTPQEMGRLATYDEGVEVAVERELRDAVARARSAGIVEEAIVLDPGIGFAKTAAQSLRLLARLDRLTALNLPILVGPSRKSFLGELLGLPPGRRAVASAVACAMAYLRGAHIFRVHDVAETVQALHLTHALKAGRTGTGVGGWEGRGE